MIARVREVTAASTAAVSIRYVPSPAQSTRTGVAPARHTASAVAMKGLAGKMQSSPAPTPSARSAISIASVPLAIPTQCRAPMNSAYSASNSATCGPSMNAVRASTCCHPSAISAATAACCAARSTSGMRFTRHLLTENRADGVEVIHRGGPPPALELPVDLVRGQQRARAQDLGGQAGGRRPGGRLAGGQVKLFVHGRGVVQAEPLDDQLAAVAAQLRPGGAIVQQAAQDLRQPRDARATVTGVGADAVP